MVNLDKRATSGHWECSCFNSTSGKVPSVLSGAKGCLSKITNWHCKVTFWTKGSMLRLDTWVWVSEICCFVCSRKIHIKGSVWRMLGATIFLNKLIGQQLRHAGILHLWKRRSKSTTASLFAMQLTKNISVRRSRSTGREMTTRYDYLSLETHNDLLFFMSWVLSLSLSN